RAIGTRDDQVIELRILEGHCPMDEVMHHHFARERILEAHHGSYTGARLSALAADAGIARLLLASDLRLAQRIEFLLGAVAAIGAAGGEHCTDDLAVPVKSLALVVRAFIGT